MSKSFIAGLFLPLLAAAGGSACCLLPWVLLLLGLNGAWVVHLTALAEYRPLFVALVPVCLAAAGWRLRRAAAVCAAGSPCGDPASVSRRRVAYRVVCLTSLFLLAAPEAAGLFI